MELRALSRILLKFAGLWLIVDTINRLPTGLLQLSSAGLSAAGGVLLGGVLFLPSLISLAIGFALVYRGDSMVARAFGRQVAEPPQNNSLEKLEPILVALVGLFILADTLSTGGYYLFVSVLIHLQNETGQVRQSGPIPPDGSVVFTLVLRVVVALLLIIGRHNVARLRQRIAGYRPINDNQDIYPPA